MRLVLLLYYAPGFSAPLAVLAAQPAVSAWCQDDQARCIAECRARLFAVDPARAECVAACADRPIRCGVDPLLACCVARP